MSGHLVKPFAFRVMCAGADEGRHFKSEPYRRESPEDGAPDEIVRRFVADKIPRKERRKCGGGAGGPLEPFPPAADHSGEQEDGRNTMTVALADEPVIAPQADKGDDQKEEGGGGNNHQPPCPGGQKPCTMGGDVHNWSMKRE